MSKLIKLIMGNFFGNLKKILLNFQVTFIERVSRQLVENTELAKTVETSHCAATRTGLFCSYPLFACLCMLSLACFGAALWGGYHLASVQLAQAGGLLSGEWRQYLQMDRRQLKDLEWQTQQQLVVISEHIGKIEADLRKTNALGEHLVKQARLDATEFNFSAPKQNPLASSEAILPNLKLLGIEVEKQYLKMQAIHLALHRQLSEQEIRLSGLAKPVTGGRVSSFFGSRRDPFSGHRAFHGGVDIVAKEGSSVKALAAGIVSFADRKGAYGRLIEINHGNGLSTRYGHNKQLLVKPGQLVKKGETIALLGSSGRSTGAHVHLEVRKDGRAVDPGLYFADLVKS